MINCFLPGGFNGGIDEALSSGHAVEEELLRPDAGHEAAVDESAGAGMRLVGAERGQRLARDHQRGTLTYRRKVVIAQHTPFSM